MHSHSKPTPLSSVISSPVSSPSSSPTMVRVKHLAQHKRSSVRPPVCHVPFDDNPSDSSTNPPSSSFGRTVNLSDLLNNPPPCPSVPPFQRRKRSKNSFVADILGRAKKSRPSTPGAPFGPSEPASSPSVGPSVSSFKISSPPRSLSPSLSDEDVPITELFRRERPPSQGKAPARDSSSSDASSSDFDPRTGQIDSDDETPFVPHPSKPLRRRILPNVPSVPLDDISFSSEGAMRRWKYVILRRLAVEKALSDEMLHCHDIMDLIRHAGLQFPYSLLRLPWVELQPHLL